MRKCKLRLIVLTLAAALLLQLPAAAGFGSARAFTDVSSGHWARTYIDRLSSLGIVDGYADGSFLPEKELTCGEFMKMLAVSSELYTENLRVTVHWAQPYWTMLDEANVLDGVDIPCTAAALNRTITRYEMAVMLSNVTVNVFWEPRVNVDNPGGTIADYSAIPTAYKDAVEQVYGKGIITGYKSTAGIADGAFVGSNTLTRAQATAVLVRLLWGSERQMASFANEGERPVIPTVDPGYVPFATRIQNEGLVDAWGRPSASLCTQLFGSSGKTYFHSSADAAPYMQTISVTSGRWTPTARNMLPPPASPYISWWPMTSGASSSRSSKARSASPSSRSAARALPTRCATPGAAPSTSTPCRTPIAIIPTACSCP